MELSSIEITSESWGQGNKKWLATRKGFDTCRTITLDLALFLVADGFGANGYIPSGTVVGVVTATGLYGPYATAAVDGTGVARYHILDDVRLTDGDGNAFTKAAVAGLWEGVVIEANLPTFSGALGEIDATGKADMTFIKYE